MSSSNNLFITYRDVIIAYNNKKKRPDPVDLEYARKATDMVLDYLDRQRDEPDKELLEELNWTADDLRRFSERWKKVRQMEQFSADAEQSREVEDALRVLGHLWIEIGEGVEDHTHGFVVFDRLVRLSQRRIDIVAAQLLHAKPARFELEVTLEDADVITRHA